MKEKKAALRKVKIAKREALSHEEHKGKSELIQENLFKQKEFQQAEVVAFFVGVKKEVHTKRMIQHALEEGKIICVPVCDFKKHKLDFARINSLEDLKENSYGGIVLEEPKKECERIPLKEIDLIIVPGLAFDEEGHRLGYGKGFYDKVLGSKEFSGKSIGLCFDFQLKKEIPHEEHDMKIDKIVTEERISEAQV